MVSTTITFKQDNLQPPVYVAGAFTGWSPIEMSFETTESDGSPQNVFSYKADLEPGDYQYKFKLGPGDWWVLDESSPTANDAQGNVNNVVSVQAQVPGPIEHISKPVATILNTKDAHIIEDEHDRQHENGLASASEAVENSIESQNPRDEVTTSGEDAVAIDDKPTHDVDHSVRKDSIPDFAPPPYSIATNGTVSPPPPPVSSATDTVPNEKQPARSVPNGKESSISSFFNTRNLVLIVAIVVVPAAVSHYLRR
ncbi:hypothetical protein AYO20_00676 [Fonsecaea nubica]|uniref:AMP-activated protein kinase glycogen-binding domain-containing protein n=1 Tax=Fonsecaea nubica TaxID=856822 RepID=A0A178DEQ4_9EURO|nr:hypothetical protein AYO20_00676 [Fonsecaea nubica]OAL40256.1 hypothetical protein AYO20_00676 [Fonsecaea nubica]